MKFSISKTDFLNALQIASQARSARATLPILGGILLSAEDDGVFFQATDLEMSIRHLEAAHVEEKGSVVVPGKTVLEIVKNLPDAAVSFRYEVMGAHIDCLNSHYLVKTMEPEDFPAFPTVSPTNEIKLPAADIAAMVKKVSKATSRDESHAVLTGICLTVQDEMATLAATDSYRLAVGKVPAEGCQGEFKLVVPGTSFEIASRTLQDAKEISIGYNDSQILFTFGNTELITRKLEGNYPDYLKIIPKEKTITATADTQAFATAVKRVSVMAQDFMKMKLEFDPAAQQILVLAYTDGHGAASEAIDAQIEGEKLEIGFNYQYVMDGINAIETEEFAFEATAALKPGVFRAIGGDEYFYLSMPVKLDKYDYNNDK